MYVFDDKNTIAASRGRGNSVPLWQLHRAALRETLLGGANSVRDGARAPWGRNHDRDTTGSDFGSRVGDVKLDLSLEFRRKVSHLFELAGFIDAGNIWTIKDYEEQPGGLFEWNSFYKELAVSYGVGVTGPNFLSGWMGDESTQSGASRGAPGGQFLSPISDAISRFTCVGYPF